MKKFIFFIAVIFAMAGCSKNETDDAAALPNRTVKNQELSIIAGTMSLAEILDDLGYKNVVGVPSSRHPVPDRYKDAVKIGRPMQPDLETVKRLNPDLYLSSVGSKPTIERLFANRQIKTEFFNLDSYEECLNSIKQLGVITSKEKEAERVIQTIEAKVLELRRSISGKKSPKVLMILGSPKKLMMGTKNCYTGSLMEVLKIHNIAGDIGNFDKTYVPIDIEEIVKHQPDVIIRLTHTKSEDSAGSLREEFAKSGIWQKVNAVKTNRIYDLDSALYTVSRNIKISHAVEDLKNLIYGE